MPPTTSNSASKETHTQCGQRLHASRERCPSNLCVTAQQHHAHQTNVKQCKVVSAASFFVPAIPAVPWCHVGSCCHVAESKSWLSSRLNTPPRCCCSSSKSAAAAAAGESGTSCSGDRGCKAQHVEQSLLLYSTFGTPLVTPVEAAPGLQGSRKLKRRSRQIAACHKQQKPGTSRTGSSPPTASEEQQRYEMAKHAASLHHRHQQQ
jgi:hypothetical protein